MSNTEVESKLPTYYKGIFLSLILLSILTFFFPYKIINEIAGYQTNILGFSNYHEAKTRIINGFEFPLNYIGIFLMVLCAVLILFVSNRIAKILALVFSGILGVYMLFLFAALDFVISIFGPPVEASVGFGYYLWLIVSIIFISMIIISYRKSITFHSKKIVQQDLLDDI